MCARSKGLLNGGFDWNLETIGAPAVDPHKPTSDIPGLTDGAAARMEKGTRHQHTDSSLACVAIQDPIHSVSESENKSQFTPRQTHQAVAFDQSVDRLGSLGPQTPFLCI